jgi:hypothetical protein
MRQMAKWGNVKIDTRPIGYISTYDYIKDPSL